jgi:hypothetical protein
MEETNCHRTYSNPTNGQFPRSLRACNSVDVEAHKQNNLLHQLLRNGRQMTHQGWLIPENVRLLVLQPVSAFIRNSHVKVEYDLGQYEPHLSICQAEEVELAGTRKWMGAVTSNDCSADSLSSNTIPRPKVERLHRV